METLFLAGVLTLAAAEVEQQTVILVVGAPGTSEYGALFEQWAARWEQAAEEAGARVARIGSGAGDSIGDKQALQLQLNGALAASPEPLWLVLIGHGTFDGQAAKFNLRGPDVSSQELAEWLKPCERPLVVVNCASASGPFINRLSGANRVVVTATKSGFESNFSRFGEYLSEAVLNQSTDLDKDEQTSLLEAYLAAATAVREFYEQESRLATEHALVDDNGDGLGTPADWFSGVRATRTAKDGELPDGALAAQMCLIRSPSEREISPESRAERDALERQLLQLRQTKEQRPEEAYYAELETVLLKLAHLYANLEKSAADSSTDE